MAKATMQDVVPGQRFEQRGGSVWQVMRLISFPGEALAHVQLVNERDPTTSKTVSVDALLDRNLFRMVEDRR